MKYHKKVIVWLVLGLLWSARLVAAEPDSLDPIRLGVTTGLQDSGLLNYLLPVFTREYGYKFITQPVGSGKALRLGRRGEVDGVWVNSPSAENLFVEQGYGIERYPVMRDDFVILGPIGDPAGIAASKNVHEALVKIFDKEGTFISRGDDSGTHQRELRLWGDAGLDPYGAPWYLEVGVGMREAIAIAENKNAYIISDRATFFYLKPSALGLLLEDADHLYNYYSIIAVNPKHFPNVNYRGMHTFIQWLISNQGQKVIAGYQESGRQLFMPEQLFLYDDD